MSTRPTVLVTGASTGIGAVYAERFAQRGHDLVLVARDQARLDALAARLRSEHDVAVDVIPADLTQPGDLTTVENRLRDDARIGILVNNAGAALSGHFVEQSTDKVAQLVALNTTALVRLASAIAPRLAKAGDGDGAIINISTAWAFEPSELFPTSAVFRAGLASFSKIYADKYAADNIRINNVLPGWIDSLPATEQRREGVPLKRYGTSEEIAATIAFLASEGAAYITGQNIKVDGGVTRSV